MSMILQEATLDLVRREAIQMSIMLDSLGTGLQRAQNIDIKPSLAHAGWKVKR